MKRRIAAFSLALTALSSASLAGPGETNAWSYAAVQGRAGTVAAPRVSMIDTYIMPGVLAPTIMSSAELIAYRSPATNGAQDVVAIYSIERWNGSSWYQVTSQVQRGRIPQGSSGVRLRQLCIQPNSAMGYYRVQFAVAWAAAGNSNQLGNVVVTPSVASDFACNSPYRPCETAAGWFRFGRLYSFGGGW
jgi:hypothetical protein